MPRLRASVLGHGRGGRLVAAALACLLAAVFWVPALAVSRGYFPAPLDDVYIHFGFARSLGLGHPFEWIPGQGYSSGETSPLYAVVLAMGWAVGFRGRALGLWAALVAVGSVASLLGSVRRLLRPMPAWLAWLVALLPVSIGIVDWALFSGMEVAVFAAALGRAVEALAGLDTRSSSTRATREWRLFAWGVALVWLRPEAAIVVAVLSLVAARGTGAAPATRTLARVAAPGALATLAVLALNRLATGDARSAGAQLKLLSSNPYLSEVDRARVFVEHLVTFWVKVVRGELAVRPLVVLALLGFAVAGLARRETRRVSAACLGSALGWTLLVSWNGNAPNHNFRYYAPALVLFMFAVALGFRWITTMPRIGAFGAMVVIASGASRIPAQVRHFRSASGNIRDQHVEIANRLARLGPGTRVLLGDAGAIPYVSGLGAVDALGLGGYRRFPFAHAAVFGEAASVELIERLDPGMRPTHFALYPNWFAGLTSRFGIEIDRVTIQDNVICGSPTKAIYVADWSALGHADEERPELADALDVADVVDEQAHGYAPPLPHGGWTTLDVLTDGAGARRFDGGRTIPDGASESFIVRRGAKGPLVLRVRIDALARGIELRSRQGARALDLEPAVPGSWRSAVIAVDGVTTGEQLTLTARGGEYRDYHVWIERSPAYARSAPDAGTGTE